MKKRATGSSGREVYALTPTGKSLSAPLTELYRWGEKHATLFGVKCGDPLARLEDNP
jgi:DNA-binding HxlR family transcriptional regulator